MKTRDFLAYWGRSETCVHPDDRPLLAARNSGRNAFGLDCLVRPFLGPLASAPLVFVWLNAKLDNAARAEAQRARLRCSARIRAVRDLAVAAIRLSARAAQLVQ